MPTKEKTFCCCSIRAELKIERDGLAAREFQNTSFYTYLKYIFFVRMVLFLLCCFGWHSIAHFCGHVTNIQKEKKKHIKENKTQRELVVLFGFKIEHHRSILFSNGMFWSTVVCFLSLSSLFFYCYLRAALFATKNGVISSANILCGNWQRFMRLERNSARRVDWILHFILVFALNLRLVSSLTHFKCNNKNKDSKPIKCEQSNYTANIECD